MMSVHAVRLALLAISIASGIIGSAVAQVYPSRPITIVSPFPAGGPNDALARIVAESMRASLGQPVIVENVGGASGSIGAGRAARAAPDGYTLLSGGWVTQVLNGAALALQYNVANDFEPVCLLTLEPLMVVSKKAMPANDLKELIAWLKANPDKALQGTAGPGSVDEIAGVLFQRETGTHFQFVPYRGSGQFMQDLMVGRIDFLITLAPAALPQVRVGTIKAYAVTDKHRLEAAPEIPTVDEAGLPEFHISNWQALWAPKATPKDIIAKLNAAVVDALADPSVRQRLASAGRRISPREQQTPDALRAFHKAEIERWWPIIKTAGIKAE
jgi:tripartite-type tricarboxylate transporter receptor subunit TctC